MSIQFEFIPKAEHDRLKYRLTEDFHEVLHFRWRTTVPDPRRVIPRFARLDSDGLLTIHKGYAWDGATCAIDTVDFLRGSCVHDVLYQMIRLELLSGRWRKAADQELQRICIEDGMSKFRAWRVYWGVRLFGGIAGKLG